MRVVIQRVKEARVRIQNYVAGEIQSGIVVLAGFEETDTEDDLDWTASKIAQIRIFADTDGKMNLSLKEVNGKILLISQFTLHALTKKGNRPSYIKAARPEQAIPLYEKFITLLEQACDEKIETGKFGADMQIELINDGPVTIFIDSKNKE